VPSPMAWAASIRFSAASQRRDHEGPMGLPQITMRVFAL
jgi:hypothetical protein